jgi:hypothetical protein
MTHRPLALIAFLSIGCGGADDAVASTPEGTGGAAGAGGTTSAGSGGSYGASGQAGKAGAGQAGKGGASTAGSGGGTSAGGTSAGSGGTSPGGSGGTSAGGGNGGTSVGGGSGGTSAGGSGGTTKGLSVSGNQLLRDGKPFRIHGVNHSGSEFACVQGTGLFDGPSDASLAAAMKTWNVNAVRIPLNEDCWLGINGVKPDLSGPIYRKAIVDLMSFFHAQGMIVIVDLHWNAAGSTLATAQQVMADADHAPEFWKSVATALKDDPEVIFDLYNEPHDVSWSCWKSGCSSNGFMTAGMQDLVTAVRSTGATQPLMVGGLAYSNDLSQWLANAPTDPLNAIVASHHSYNFNACVDASCWDDVLVKVAAKVPLVIGEIGENDCGSGYIQKLMPWADAHGVGYLGWTWNTWDCKTGPALISKYDGTPTAFGQGFRDHLLTLSPLPGGTLCTDVHDERGRRLYGVRVRRSGLRTATRAVYPEAVSFGISMWRRGLRSSGALPKAGCWERGDRLWGRRVDKIPLSQIGRGARGGGRPCASGSVDWRA